MSTNDMKTFSAPGADSGIIRRIDTVRWADQPHALWLQVHTSEGLVGLGETYFIPGAVEAVIHEMAAPFLLGGSAELVGRHWTRLFSHVNFYGTAGAEMRAMSAIDIALWDILGQAVGRPVHALLGGSQRETIPVYNTCVNAGKFADQDAFLADAGALAAELRSAGFAAMKIWPWDRFAPQMEGRMKPGPAGWTAMGPMGHHISPADLQKGLACVAAIRDRVGSSVEVMIEGHARWDLNSALQIARALEPYDPRWMEDITQPTSAKDLRRLVVESRIPQAVSERLITRFPFREVLELAAAHVVLVDVCWTGGISEARKIAEMADAYHLPMSPHDCIGPVALFSNLHLAAGSPNAMIVEVVRGFCQGGWYSDVVEDDVEIADGNASFPYKPGLGTRLRADFLARPDVTIRTSTA